MNTPRLRRPTTSFYNQDRAGAAGGKRGLFLDGRHLADIPADDTTGEATRAAVAAELGIPEGQIEALLVCVAHPTISAVDCTICAPE